MKKEMYVLSIIIVAMISFSIGYFLIQPVKFDSCKLAYEDLKESDLCRGKFEDYVGTSDVVGNIEWFKFNWDEDIGAYGHAKNEIIGPNERCYNQGYRQFIETGKYNSLIECFANQVEIENDILEIQCGCLIE